MQLMPRTRLAQPKGNRTDLPATPGPAARQPIRVPTGLAYGQAGDLRAAEQAVPLPQGPTITPPSPTQPQPPSPDPLAAALGPGVRNFNFEPVGLYQPSTRPSEPVTAGLPIGAGPGPEAVPSVGFGAIGGQQDTGVDLLQRIASFPGASSDSLELLRRAQR